MPVVNKQQLLLFCYEFENTSRSEFLRDIYGPMFDVMNKLPVNDSLYCNEYTLTNIETMSGTSVNSK